MVWKLKLNKMEEITKKQFNRYEGVRLSGATNMFDVRNVKALSWLNQEQIMVIMTNYVQLKEKYDERK